jgi:hypothetical protein
MSVLALHHPGRRAVPPGQAGRGSGALLGHADILIEMYGLGRLSRGDRRRKLLAFSRYPETPAEMVLALNEQGTDYVNLGDTKGVEFAEHWPVLQAILEKAATPVNRRAILQAWPGNKPEPQRLRRWLEEAVARGLLRKWGKGVKNQPFRYWLPSREEEWRNDPLGEMRTPELFYTEGFERKMPEGT